MKALRSFTVRPTMPEELAPLESLAMNLRWSGDSRTRDLFRWVDPDQGESIHHDPVDLIGRVSQERLDSLVADPAFMSFLGEVHDDLTRYLASKRWFQSRSDTPLKRVAYFSPEFGIAEAVPQYSGGLGVLAGDHLKAASGLGVPLVGIGLLYRQGYFRQALNADGWQQERYPTLNPHSMALTRLDGCVVEVDLAGRPLRAQVWRAEVGRVPLYFLDADIDDNDPEARLVTDRLYGGATEHRIRQEILLGIGGVRALDVVGEDTQVFHTNEGHAGFLGLERIRRLMTGDGLTFPEAIEAVRAGTVFTTHTPVPAGIDRFPRELMEKYFASWAEECGIPLEDLLGLGRFPGEDADAAFNMAVMGLRLAGQSNGVAKLHAKTSRTMFQPLWPDVPADEAPIGSVTNGVHAYTWISPEMDDLLSRSVLPAWHEATDDAWERVHDIRDDELWRAREQGRDRLVAFVRSRLRRSLLARGVSESDTAWCDEVLDPHVLTIGFARRFATYKRADLILSDPDRLKAVLLSTDRPVQLLFAGKAHPADDKGKEMIKRIVQFSRDPEVRHRIVFIDDYDIAVARMMVQGSDVWLNNPRRPQEASGTSGMKAALNGSLNCSILDGWWAEMFDGENGWSISSAESVTDVERRDEIEASSLYDILEQQVIPLFYERHEGRVPRRWVHKIKHNLRTLGPEVQAARMVRDYVIDMYEPAGARADAVIKSGLASAKDLAAWKIRVTEAWPQVHVVAAESNGGLSQLGGERHVEATVELGSLSSDDVEVQLVHGSVGWGDEIINHAVVSMVAQADDRDGPSRYVGMFKCETAGRYGFTVRVVPSHPQLIASAELGRVAWA
ncbi:MAG: alpha-glucan family phosphorylase [Acidimicrobiales bacterium]